MKAKSLEQYRQAWEHHIKELASLALAANVEYTEYVQVKDQLEHWLKTALTNFSEET